MSNQIVKALEHGAQKLGKTLAEDAGKALKNFYRHAGDNLKKVAKNVREVEEKHVKDLEKILKGEGTGSLPHPRTSSGRGGGKGSLGRGGRRGQGVDGNIGCHTAGDPVDVVSGQVITSETDLVLPGLLSVVLRRAYASDYVGGRLFGPGWSSTLDQRVEIDGSGLHFAGDDAQILHYPFPQVGSPVQPEAGARWPLTWDSQTGDFRIEDPDRGLVRHFTGPGQGAYRMGETRPISALTDRNGHRVEFVRDEEGTLLEVRHSGGYRVAVDTIITSNGVRAEALRLLDGTHSGLGTTVVGYQYYPQGQLAGIVNSSGLPYVYEYDDANRMTAWIDRNGQSYEYEYDQAGRAVRGIGQDGILSASFRYDTDLRVTVATDSLGHDTEYHYDEQHRVHRTVDPLGNTTLTGYDEAGRVVSRTDEIGRTTLLVLDDHGDPVRITEPGGSVIELAYTKLRQVASVTQGGTTVATFDYDPRGNLITSTDAAGATTTRQYDSQGRLLAVTDALGHTQRLESNPAGLTTAITDAAGTTTHATYDTFGRIATFTDALGATTSLTRRTEGHITERRLPDGTRETWEYDPEGNLVRHEHAGAITALTIGPFGKLAARTLPDGEEQRFEYDTELQLLSVATNGAAWRYRYDQAGHLIGESDFNGRELTYRLDGADQLLTTTDTAGRTTTFTYDLQGRLAERRNHEGTTTALAYDALGRLSQVRTGTSVLDYTHDALGRVVSETVDGRTTSFTYDAAGRRTSRTTPTGITSTWTYDAAGRPTTLANQLAALTFAYDGGGRETTRYLGAGAALTQTWDPCDRLSGQSIWASDPSAQASGGYTNVQQRTYSYRADGMPAAVTDRLRGGHHTFELTPAGRVTKVSADTWNETYAYDRLGNITHAHDTRTPDNPTNGERAYQGSLLHAAGRTSYEYDDQGRLVRRLARTLSGQRREWRYTWNAEDQLVGLDTPDRGSWAYSYDPLGRRTAKWRLAEDGSELERTHFAWDGTQLTEQYRALPDGTRHSVTWDWDPGAWKPLTQTERAWQQDRQGIDERFYAIVTDLVDAPSELVTTDGQIAWSDESDLWGRRREGADNSVTCPLGRPGQYHDPESGLGYNYFRYYDPSTGRYLSSDPLGVDGGPNPHAYVPNPLFFVDPLGLSPKRQPVGWGGSHYSLRPSNWTDGSDNNRYERNHIPARNSYLGVGSSVLGEGPGPAIRMDYDDHRDFISTGSSHEGIAWRAKQRALIAQGKFDVAMKMDIGMIRKIHGTKYDAAIKEMVDSLPHNKSFQKYLSDNGWKIRTCLLK
ncbi:RHS repeat-associated core domain-containing protein [Kitasatospora sp. NPDC048407]|uniref:RHS repeat-associated core domain-containing protein n=1 Tax=Kitasatospora sp. NPDC048407 TaxID=3364051 RepID=UPI003713F774